LGKLPQSGGLPELFVAVTGRQAPFNRWHDSEELGANFRIGSRDEFGDHLIFIASQLGEPYYVFGRHQVSVYQLETDVEFPERTMSAVGRYMLFQAVHPSSKVRVEVALTASLAGDRQNRLPPAAVVGQTRTALPMLGRGSARVISEPLQLQMIDGRPFLAVDMGTLGTFFSYEPRGLMRLYGRDVRLDHRQMVGFLRDVSLVSDEDYQALKPPTVIRNFPQDLMDKNVEYSGIYEDGWVGDHSFVTLRQPPGAARLVCRMVVPDIPSNKREWLTTEVTITVDGKQVARKRVEVGEAALAAELPPGAGRRRIELSFSELQNLPDPDGRPVGAELEQIAIEPATPAMAASSAH
jgi:hypothetical protein